MVLTTSFMFLSSDFDTTCWFDEVVKKYTEESLWYNKWMRVAHTLHMKIKVNVTFLKISFYRKPRKIF